MIAAYECIVTIESLVTNPPIVTYFMIVALSPGTGSKLIHTSINIQSMK